MDKTRYDTLCQQGYTRIPLCITQLHDTETPLQLYQRVASGPYSYLFESVESSQQWGRYSFIGLPSRHIIRINGSCISEFLQGKCIGKTETDDVFAWLKAFQRQFTVPLSEQLPARFGGGLVGYYAYDAVRYVEPRLAKTGNPDTLDLPDVLFTVSDELFILDNFTSQLHCIVYADATKPDGFERAQARLQSLLTRLATAPAVPLPSIELSAKTLPLEPMQSNLDYAAYKNNINTIKDYILAGDVMQVVPSRRLHAPQTCSPINLYRALRHLNPSPYLYYLNLDDFHIVGSSPEILVRKEGDIATIRPLAGTRPRGATRLEDTRLAEELLQDEKECAEHLMLIDLARNDIGRVAQTGSVQVTEKMCVEYFSHVMHITSNVIGELRETLDEFDLLMAALPAGTLSGAPKIRAMEIIDELETLKRGIYGGAVGYIGWNGNMDLAIAIRTAIIKDNTVFTQVGAGIVADSDPKTEWDETIAKSAAICQALALAKQLEKAKNG